MRETARFSGMTPDGILDNSFPNNALSLDVWRMRCRSFHMKVAKSLSLSACPFTVPRLLH